MARINPSREKVIGSLARLAIEFASSNKSQFQLVEESGVGGLVESVSTTELSTYLRDNSHLIDRWLKWSEDKRAASGPYFMKTDGIYEVGILQAGGTCSVQSQFEDPFEACAEFLKLELLGGCGAT